MVGGASDRRAPETCPPVETEHTVLTEEPSTRTEPARRPTISHPLPAPIQPGVELPPDGLRYRLKNKLLGPPLHTEQLEHERLGKPTALAVFASDNLSSSAYATEEMLRVLVPVIGLAAFSLVVPITVALLTVLLFLILSYRQTIKAYPTAGGAYMVTRDNFGLMPAQVAGVALLTDYVLTVSVSVAAGTAALASAFSVFTPWILPISILFVVIIAWGNLRGVKESGKLFAVPTYFFILNMAVLIGVGVFKSFHGGLSQADYHGVSGVMTFGKSGGDGLLVGASLALVLHAFASGGAAVTGVEAISNGVPAFRQPAWKNARSTLVIMGTLLGVMFLGLSLMDSHMHVAPFTSGTPTVISQIGQLAYGNSLFGQFLYYCLQAGTMLILVLAANTSFADFPRLASFHAGDNFMPRQLTKRGHRLVFSNGIIFLAIAGIVLLIATDAKVDRLIPLYAIGVFTSFTLSQAGMAKHHIREKEQGWRWGLFINGTGAIMTAVITVVIALLQVHARRVGDRRLRPDHGDVPRAARQAVRAGRPRTRARSAASGRRTGTAPPRGDGVRRPARPRGRARDAVRTHAAARRAARGALRGRPGPRRPARRRLAHARPRQHGPRAHRLPRSPARELGRRDRRARAEQRRLRGVRAAAGAHVQRRVAPHPARPDRGVDGPRDRDASARQRHDRAVPLRRAR